MNIKRRYNADKNRQLEALEIIWRIQLPPTRRLLHPGQPPTWLTGWFR